MTLTYKINEPVTTDQFISLLDDSGLGARRPLHDRACMAGMLRHANLTVTAWDDKGDRDDRNERNERNGKDEAELVGLARCMTDFHYACYLSDLAVRQSHQRQGVGKQLQNAIKKQLGPRCKLILIAAPAASDYYRRLGFTHNDRCWVLDPAKELTP